MTYKFGSRSKIRMEGLHPDLVAVLEIAIKRTPIDFTVLEGLRTEERQRELVRDGKSQTMNSRHLTGHAVDIAPLVNGQATWDWKYYNQLAPIMKQAAADLGVNLEWGGDWTSFKDGPHWQLSWSVYDKDDMQARHQSIDPGDFSAPPKARTSLAQSSTLQATAATAVAGATGVGTAVGALDGTAQIVLIVAACVAALGLAWIARERIKKWAKGVR